MVERRTQRPLLLLRLGLWGRRRKKWKQEVEEGGKEGVSSAFLRSGLISKRDSCNRKEKGWQGSFGEGEREEHLSLPLSSSSLICCASGGTFCYCRKIFCGHVITLPRASDGRQKEGRRRRGREDCPFHERCYSGVMTKQEGRRRRRDKKPCAMGDTSQKKEVCETSWQAWAAEVEKGGRQHSSIIPDT